MHVVGLRFINTKYFGNSVFFLIFAPEIKDKSMTQYEIDYRGLYESSTMLLLYNVVKDIAAIVSTVGMVKLTRKNKIAWNGQKITGVILQEEGMFIVMDNKTIFEISDEDPDFKEFSSNPLNVVTLYENIIKELKLTDKKDKKDGDVHEN